MILKNKYIIGILLVIIIAIILIFIAVFPRKYNYRMLSPFIVEIQVPQNNCKVILYSVGFQDRRTTLYILDQYKQLKEIGSWKHNRYNLFWAKDYSIYAISSEDYFLAYDFINDIVIAPGECDHSSLKGKELVLAAKIKALISERGGQGGIIEDVQNCTIAMEYSEWIKFQKQIKSM